MVTVYRYSVTFNAPIKFVYNWCTDYREDDPEIIGADYRRIILEKSKKRVIFVSDKKGPDGSTKLAVRVVTLSPSKNAWHLDYFGEEDLEKGDYRLKSLGEEKTRLDMVFKNTWKNGAGPTSEEFTAETKSSWDAYAPALERDYHLENRKT
jgi:hypothetical protein